MLQREIEHFLSAKVLSTGFDGRSDVIVFSLSSSTVERALDLRLAEDVFIELGRARRQDPDRAGWLAGRLWKEGRARVGLDAWTRITHHGLTRTGYRVVVRVLDERMFKRTELRRHLTHCVARNRSAWAVRDPAPLELWALEYRRGTFVMGARLSDARMRKHAGRAVERIGALRPTLAAAMVLLAGEEPGALLDPCCGSGTILMEATGRGWTAFGGDIDSHAIAVARANTRSRRFYVSDTRRLPLESEAVAACVSNLPFGRRYQLPDDERRWLSNALGELARVTKAGGRVVVLHPSLPINGLTALLRLRDKTGLRLLGVPTAIWVFDRVASSTPTKTVRTSPRHNRGSP
jgi:SAM-dependent methyltransferase